MPDRNPTGSVTFWVFFLSYQLTRFTFRCQICVSCWKRSLLPAVDGRQCITEVTPVYYHHCKYKFSFFDRVTDQMKEKYQEEPIRTQREKKSQLPKARENAGDQVVIGFSFASDWLRNRRKFSESITVRSKAKLKNTKLPIALFGHYITFTFSYRSIAHKNWKPWTMIICDFLDI